MPDPATSSPAPRCDSHVHIVGPAERYPQVAGRTYLAGPALLETLQREGRARGIERFVIVQPSFYGTDNSALLDALDALQGNGRAVAVVDPATVADDVLADYHRRGVRGLRVNLYSPLAGVPVADTDAAFQAMASHAARRDWHVEIVAPLAVVRANADLIAGSPVPVVIDHYGIYGRVRPDDDDGRSLLELMRLTHVWMKLSAPYRLDRGPLYTQPDPAWLAAMLAAAPERCVWGSDWPHTPPHDTHRGADVTIPYLAISYARLVDDFLAALAPASLADAVMGGNAAGLYGF